MEDQTIRQAAGVGAGADMHPAALVQKGLRGGQADALAAAGNQYDTIRHWAVPPPSTGITAPVMNEAASEARKETARAISIGLASRPKGTAAR